MSETRTITALAVRARGIPVLEIHAIRMITAQETAARLPTHTPVAVRERKTSRGEYMPSYLIRASMIIQVLR